MDYAVLALLVILLIGAMYLNFLNLGNLTEQFVLAMLK